MLVIIFVIYRKNGKGFKTKIMKYLGIQPIYIELRWPIIEGF